VVPTYRSVALSHDCAIGSRNSTQRTVTLEELGLEVDRVGTLRLPKAYLLVA